MGSALTLVATPLGVRSLVPVVDTAAVLGGIGAIAGSSSLPLATRMTQRSRCRARAKVWAPTSADFDNEYLIGVDEATPSGSRDHPEGMMR